MAQTTAKDLFSDPVQMSLRLPGALMQQVRDSARDAFRSVNAEINYRISASFAEQSDASSSKAAACSR